MFSLSKLYDLTVQCSQNPSPPGMNDMRASVLSPRVWLITRLFSTLFSGSPLWKKIDCIDIFPWFSHKSSEVNYWHIENWCVMCQIPSTDLPLREPVTELSCDLSKHRMLRTTFSFFLSPWPEVFGKSSSLNVCCACAATIFYPYQYNMEWKGLCFLKALDSQ